MKRVAILFAMIIVPGAVMLAQDINFSQFYELPLLRNPALAGIYRGDIRVTSAFRNQWGSVTVPYQTQALGIETRFGPGQSGDFISLGLQLTNDLAGDSKMGKTQIFPMFTYHKWIGDNENSYLSLGFIGGPVLQRFDPSKLRFSDQFVNGAYHATNPTRQTFSKTSKTYWDAAAGISFSSETGNGIQYYLGAAYFHFTQPKVAFDQAQDIRLNKKFVVNAGMSLPAGDRDRLILYADHFMQGGHSQTQGGALYKHDLLLEEADYGISIAIGAFYRWNDAIIPAVKLGYYKWALGFTYDANISKLKTASQGRGGMEVTLSFSDFLKFRNSELKRLDCKQIDFY
jgi:Bacteroidetes-specific putative membrane protein